MPRGEAKAARTSRRRRRASIALHVCFAAAGITALVWVIRHVGPGAIAAALRAAWSWLPVVIAIEGVRIGIEAVATRWALGSRGALVPWPAMVRAHLAAYPVCTLAPAGRAAAEAAKAALLARFVGTPAATAVALTNQALTLVATGVFSLPCLWAAWRLTGSSSLTTALVFHFLGLTVAGVTMRFAMRAGGIRVLISRYVRRLEFGAGSFHAAAHEVSAMPAKPLVAMLAGRSLQVLQLGLLARSVGVDATLPGALVATGVALVAMAAGTLVPAQVGATEGAFALAAGALGASVADAVVIGLATHVVQLVFVVLGALIPLFWRLPAREQPSVCLPEAPAPVAREP